MKNDLEGKYTDIVQSYILMIYSNFNVSFQGVSNLVGNAVAMKRSFVDSTPVIGVNAWGAVHGNQDLIVGEEQVLNTCSFPSNKYLVQIRTHTYVIGM